MTIREYNAVMKRLGWRYGVIFFSVVIPGALGGAYLADRIANSSSWHRENVFLAMLPVFLAPVIIAGVLLDFADRKLGLKCPSCGQSLSIGRHVRRLMKDGGACPKCGTLVVEPETNAKPGAPKGAQGV
jgi:predicted RNA-binding Zn-ribbon protein involved in translation (DUF1610 family)